MIIHQLGMHISTEGGDKFPCKSNGDSEHSLFDSYFNPSQVITKQEDKSILGNHKFSWNDIL